MTKRNMRKNKCVSLPLAVLCALLCAAPLFACTPKESPWSIREETPEQAFRNDEFYYSLLPERGEAVITGYIGKSQEVVVPAELGGCPVREIRDFGSNTVKRVVLPDGLLAIGAEAFHHTALEEIEIPDSVQRIGPDAFYSTPWLDAQTDEFIVVGDGVLIGCSLPEAESGAEADAPPTEMRIPDGVKHICLSFSEEPEGTYAVFIPSGVRSIGDYAFSRMNIASISFEEGVREIGAHAFDGALHIETLELPDSLLYIGDGAFRGNESLRRIVLGKHTKHIGNYAFSSCESLISVDGLSGAARIGAYAFLYTPYFNNLTQEFVILGDGELVAYNGRDKDVVVPEGVKSIVDAFSGKPIESVTLPSTLRGIDDYAFSYATALESVRFSAGCAPTSVGSYAFSGCTALRTVELPSSVTRIGDYAFSECTALREITLPKDLRSLGRAAFQSCTALAALTLPASLNEIGNYAFKSCPALKRIDLPDSVYALGSGAFMECEQLTSARLPAKLTYIPDCLFLLCTRLQAVTMPEAVERIEAQAFQQCEALEEIAVPEACRDIGMSAFAGTPFLRRLHERDGAFAVLNRVLVGYDGDASEIVVPDGVERVMTMFSNYNAYEAALITSIVFPDSVTEIGELTLHGCHSLTTMTFGDGLRIVPEIKVSIRNMQAITLGRGCAYISPNAFFFSEDNACTFVVPKGSYAARWAAEKAYLHHIATYE